MELKNKKISRIFKEYEFVKAYQKECGIDEETFLKLGEYYRKIKSESIFTFGGNTIFFDKTQQNKAYCPDIKFIKPITIKYYITLFNKTKQPKTDGKNLHDSDE